MTRVTRGLASHKRHKRLLKDTKGFKGKARTSVKWAKNAKMKSGQNSYVGRKLRRRQFRAIWIVRVNAACRVEGISYSRFINGLLKAQIAVDRKILADLAVKNPAVFKSIVEAVKA